MHVLPYRMPNRCIVCGRAKDHSISLYRIPKQQHLREKCITGLKLSNSEIKSESRVCSMGTLKQLKQLGENEKLLVIVS